MTSESIYTIPAAESHEARAAQYAEFLENVLGLTVKEEYTAYATTAGTVYWLDDKKTMGFAAVSVANQAGSSTNASGVVPYYAGRLIRYSNGSYPNGTITSYNAEIKIYYQRSKSGNTIYFRFGTDKNCKMVAAKDASGDWCIFQVDVMYHKNGSVDVTCGAVVSNNSLFTAVKLPAIVADTEFMELYKVLSATSFLEANTYVSFGGKPYKVVSTGGSSTLPCFAFPVE